MRTWIVVLCAAGGGFVAGLTVATLTQTSAAKAAITNRAALEAERDDAIRQRDMAKTSWELAQAAVLYSGLKGVDLASAPIEGRYGPLWTSLRAGQVEKFWHEGRMWRYFGRDVGGEYFTAGDPNVRMVLVFHGDGRLARRRRAQRFEADGPWLDHGEVTAWSYPKAGEPQVSVWPAFMGQVNGLELLYAGDGRLSAERLRVGEEPTMMRGETTLYPSGRRRSQIWWLDATTPLASVRWNEEGEVTDVFGEPPIEIDPTFAP